MKNFKHPFSHELKKPKDEKGLPRFMTAYMKERMKEENTHGLWDNIHAKRERIKRGSGEHMRKPGEKGRPTESDFKSASEETDMRPIKKPHETSKHRKTSETPEPQSINPNDPDSRLDGTDSLVNVYKNETPGQTTAKIVKRIVKEALGIYEADYHGKEVSLNKPTKGDVKKSKVYVRDPSTGNIKKVNFGDPNMTIKKHIPARRKSFRARHHCETPGPKTKARYWSCRAW